MSMSMRLRNLLLHTSQTPVSHEMPNAMLTSNIGHTYQVQEENPIIYDRQLSGMPSQALSAASSCTAKEPETLPA